MTQKPGWVLTACCLVVAAGCNSGGEPRLPGDGGGVDSMRIAAAWSWGGRGSGGYWDGISLAVKELNQRGGVLGQPVTVHRFDDSESLRAARLTAQRIASQRRYVAVIGHLHSHLSQAAAPIYESAGVLMLTPASTAPELTTGERRLIFRTVHDDDVSAAQIVSHARSRGYRRVAICYVRSEYGLGLANAFERRATQAGIEILDRKSYEPSVSGDVFYEDLFRDWLARNPDAVMLAGTAPSAGEILRVMRLVGLDVPVFGGDGLDDAKLIETAGPASDGLEVITVFHADNPRKETQKFRHTFRARYGSEADSWAARGYEVVTLLAQAIDSAQSTTAIDVAKVLRGARTLRTIRGAITFSDDGDPLARPGVLIRAEAGRFEFQGEIPPDPAGVDPRLLAADEVVQNAAQEREEDDE